jgi:hypothetical protein
MSCFGIDNFTYVDPEKQNLNTVLSRTRELGLTNVDLINEDYEDALEFLEVAVGSCKVALYFVDGPHDYRDQLMCLELIKPHLHPHPVIVVDDANYPDVRQANRGFLATQRSYKLLFEAYTATHPPPNSGHDQEIEARQGWWNGVNVIVRDPDNRLPVMYPPTERSRKRFRK